MGLMVLGWAFFGFIYFKVGFEAITPTGISVVAAFLVAVILTAIVVCAASVYDTKLTAIDSRQTWWGRFKRTVIYFVLFAVGFVLMSRIIIFGFSNELSDEIGLYRKSIGVLPKVYLNSYFITSFALMVLPILCHYLAFLYPTRNRDRE